MVKIFRDGPPVLNVVAGQNATLDLDVGPRYHAVRLIATASFTQAGAAADPDLDDVLGTIVVNVNGDPKRTHTASQLNAILTKWNARLAATLYSKTANDLVTAVADTNAGGNYTRTSTWVLDIWFAEPTRDSYAARAALAWPTSWNNQAVGNYPANYTCDIQVQIGVPNIANVTDPAIRAEILTDKVQGAIVGAPGTSGPGVIGSDVLAAAGIVAPPVGAPVMPITYWYNFPEDYSSTAVVIRKWPFVGGTVQELDLFCQSGDDVASFTVLLDGSINRKTTKASNDELNEGYGWNNGYGNGTAGINYPAADLLSMAFDFDDDPGSALSTATFGTLELDLTLTDAAAANKSIQFVAQVYRNGLLL